MVRDITARARTTVYGNCAIFYELKNKGAFSHTKNNDASIPNLGNFVNKTEHDMYENLYLDANIGSKDTNPMYGHANGNDIHPYSMKVLYLIAF